MYRPTTLVTLALCSLFALVATASAQEVSLGGTQQKITTASAVRVRTAPETGATEVTRLKLGSVVSADARSAEQTEIGSKKDYWYPEGPQVNDPRAPEWEAAVNAHLSWWDEIVARKKKAGERLTILTEFGPADYMPSMPYTRQPLSDQWAINVYMLNLLRKRYAS